TTVHAGADDDFIDVHNPANTVNDIAAPLTVTGDGGTDRMDVVDGGETHDGSAILTSTTLTGLDMTDGITYATLQDLHITTATGHENFFIDSTHAGTTFITLGDGTQALGAIDDTVNLKSIAGVTTIDGQAGNDVFNVNVNQDGSRTFQNGIAAELNLHGDG